MVHKKCISQARQNSKHGGKGNHEISSVDEELFLIFTNTGRLFFFFFYLRLWPLVGLTSFNKRPHPSDQKGDLIPFFKLML